MKTKNILITLAILTLFSGCESAKTTPDDTLLAQKEFQVPKKFSDAKQKVHSSQVNVEDMDAKLSFIIITFEKDSTNTVLKEISVKLDKGVKDVELGAKINDNQINTGTNQKFYTYSLVTITYFTTDKTSKKSGTKTYTITSKGEVK